MSEHKSPAHALAEQTGGGIEDVEVRAHEWESGVQSWTVRLALPWEDWWGYVGEAMEVGGVRWEVVNADHSLGVRFTALVRPTVPA